MLLLFDVVFRIHHVFNVIRSFVKIKPLARINHLDVRMHVRSQPAGLDFIEELIEEWEEPDDDDDYGCIDDRSTPQECLNEWVENYEIPDTWEECYIDEDREVNGKRYSY